MKISSIIFVTISSILLLTGCNPNNASTKEISEAEFAAKLDAVKPYTYSTATIHATEQRRGTGDFALNKDFDRTENYIYYPDTGAWLVDHGDSLLRKYLYNFDSLNSFKSWVENIYLDYEYTYYSDFSVTIKENGSYYDDYGSFIREVTQTSEMTIKLNQYGYLVSMVASYNQSITQTEGNNILQGTISGNTTVDIKLNK